MNNEPQQGNEVTEGLRDWNDDRRDGSTNDLLKLAYDELRRQAHRYLQKERVGHTLQATAVVHEAYLKLVEQKSVVWKNRAHFFSVAKMMMRRILIDYARTKHRPRRGGMERDLSIENALTISVSETDVDLLALDEVLNRPAEKDAHPAEVVELRFFSGLDVVETAKVLGVSESTVKREWAMAKARLHRELTRLCTKIRISHEKIRKNANYLKYFV
jgi:RNA polymerase sigma factor (TIGR02999 family)